MNVETTFIAHGYRDQIPLHKDRFQKKSGKSLKDIYRLLSVV